MSIDLQQKKPAMSLFERYLTLWVALAIVGGILLGKFAPDAMTKVSSLEYNRVNLPVALLIWLMIYPMMLKIDFSKVSEASHYAKGLSITVIANWLIKPFTMALLGWLFFKGIFADWVDPQTATEYIAGMILLGVAPCTAMVFVWSHLTKGDANYTLVQVSINDLIMVVAFAPLTAMLLGVTDIAVPWDTLLLSVALYVVLPLVAGYFTRRQLETKNNKVQKTGTTNGAVDALVSKFKPFSVIGLLLTIVILFGLQAETILAQPQDIVLIAIPLLIQTYGIFAIAYFAAKRLRLPHNVAAPACMIGTSNFFELAVAVAISLFGLHSGAALATVVGVLVEVPVMLSLVWFANRTRHWFN